MMKKRENGQALVDSLLLLVVLVGIPLVLIFRYDARLRDFSARAARAAAGMIRSWRYVPESAPACKTAPASKAAPAAAPAPKEETQKPAAAASDGKAVSAAPAACPDKAAPQTAPAAPAK